MSDQTRRREHLKAMEHNYRVRGYEDGYHGRSAASLHATYAQAWRRGREAREAEGKANG